MIKSRVTDQVMGTAHRSDTRLGLALWDRAFVMPYHHTRFRHDVWNRPGNFRQQLRHQLYSDVMNTLLQADSIC